MENLQNETRTQAVERWNHDGGNEADYIRSVPLQMADGTNETLIHCQICRAHLENGVIKHLFYCPFEGAAERIREAAPLMLATLTEGIGIPDSPDFASDLETVANFLKVYHSLSAANLRRKAQAIRAAIAAAKGE